MALLRTGARAGLAADAVLRMGDGHDLVAHVVAVLVLAFKGFFYKFQYIETTDLVAPAAADALVDRDGIDEFRCPGLAAPGLSGHG